MGCRLGCWHRMNSAARIRKRAEGTLASRSAMGNFAEFDAADYLDNEETIVEYLTAALEDGNPDVVLAANES